VGDALEAVADGVGVVIERVDAPFVSNVWVGVELDAVYDWISECGVGVVAVDFGSEGVGSFFVQA
jgi:hypothetical protein